jgi:alpha-1,2-mannosyltransferase
MACRTEELGVSIPIRDTGQVRRHAGTIRIVAAAIAVAAMTVITAIMVGTLGYLTDLNRASFIVCSASLWLLFGIAFLLLRRAPVRAAVVVIIAGSLALGGAAMSGPPDTSTDSARYAWDGIVQNAGISPYQYVPLDDALAPERTDWLFPYPVTDGTGLHCPLPRTHLIVTSPSTTVICTAINRSGVPTIYPPTSELLFAAVRAVVPPSAEYWPFQLAGLLMSLGVTLLLLRGLRRRGFDARWVALWALSPLVASEAITNSHIDVLGALLAFAAAFLVSGGARWRGGVLLGAAIAAKLVPVLAAPALLRRQPWKVIAAAVATFLVLYIPYVATTGFAVLGYLPGYLGQEGYKNGSRFVLLTAVLPSRAALPVAVVLLLLLTVLVIWKSAPRRPWLGQLAMIGVTLLILSPNYPWYALLLLPFIAMSGRIEWMLIPLAFATHELIGATPVYQGGLLFAALGILVVTVLRRTRRQSLAGGMS